MSDESKENQPRKGRKVRVDFKRNRGAKTRKKNWTEAGMAEGSEDLDAASTERIRAKGDLSRRRTIIEGEPAPGHWQNGVVIAMRGQFADVDDGRQVWPCTVRRILRTRLIKERHPVAVGDRVLFSIVSEEDGVEREGVIEQVQERGGTLARVVGRRRHTVVANVDQVIVVASAGVPPFKPHLVDRYIVAAHAGDVEPVICLNKADLDTDGASQKDLDAYARLGYRTLATSAETGQGIETLREALRGKCSAFAGQSGVGKSSLANAVDPSLNLRTGEVNLDLRKGRHVTTTALLIRLNCGGYVVDTPGVRTFDLSAVPLNEIEMHMREFGPHIPHCKFPDCTHTHEIGCAVKAAVDAGEVSPQRYESYCRMYEERSREA